MSRNLNSIFSTAYGSNGVWSGYESGSGAGSSMKATASIRKSLVNIIQLLEIKSILDAPCGDYHWMSSMSLKVKYIGVDVVESLILSNREKFPSIEFLCLDLIGSELPEVDLIFCRDCFGHLSFNDGLAALRNFKSSGSKYMMLTTYWNHANYDIGTGPEWKPRLMTGSPFNLPPPILTVDELCEESFPRFSDKSMSLWKL